MVQTASSRHRTLTHSSSLKVQPPQLASNRLLSPEIILLVLRALSCSFQDKFQERCSKRHALLTCTRVSHSFYTPATELLYEWVEASSFPQCKKLIGTLARNPSLNRFIKVLILPDGWTNKSHTNPRRKQKIATANMAIVTDILRRCPNLDNLKMSTTKNGPLTMLSLPLNGGSSDGKVSPFSNLLLLHLSHIPFYDFSVRSSLPQHIDFSRLESLSLHRFVVWRDDLLPMIWPTLPSLRTLTLEECFLHGEELSSLLISVQRTIRTVRLIRSIFSISILSEGLGVVAEILEELFISEHWGFDGVSEAFDRFTALKTLRLEPANWGTHVYAHLPPKLQTLAIWASEESFSGWRVLEDILAFLQSDIPSSLPEFKRLEIKADANQFGPWVDHIQSLCGQHGLTLSVDLRDSLPSVLPRRLRKSRVKHRFINVWHSLRQLTW